MLVIYYYATYLFKIVDVARAEGIDFVFLKLVIRNNRTGAYKCAINFFNGISQCIVSGRLVAVARALRNNGDGLLSKGKLSE